jgi:putative chitinase
MNLKPFFDSIRTPLFQGKMTQGVVDTINAILNSCSKYNVIMPEQIAYILATAKHEAYHSQWNPDWHPVREGFTMTNTGAIKAVTSLYNAKKISMNYALPLANGLSYYGRGLVQITHPGNYQATGKRLGIDLYNNPDLALDLKVAADILVIGMKEGIFTGVKLSTYFTTTKKDALNARRIINGTDQQQRIAGMYEKFLAGLKLAV